MRKALSAVFFILSFFNIVHAQDPAEVKNLAWLRTKIEEAEKKLMPLPLSHSTTVYSKDWQWKEIGLAVMEPQSGTIRLIKIRKDRDNLYVVDPGWQVRFERNEANRTWNGFNTAFEVLDPQNRKCVVLSLKWTLAPDVSYITVKKGRRFIRIPSYSATTNYKIYSPHSRGLHLSEVIAAGRSHLLKDVEEAIRRLNNLGIRSIITHQPVTQRFGPHVFERLALIEQSDPDEFKAFTRCLCPEKMDQPFSGDDLTKEMAENIFHYLPLAPHERVWARLGLNGNKEFNHIYNYAGAAGLMQFTNNSRRGQMGTWDLVRFRYAARLPGFAEGATDHVYSIMAAILLHDLNAAELVNHFGPQILNDPELEYYLAAAYNGGIGRVITGIRKYNKNWTLALLRETRIYVEELEYLRSTPSEN